MKNCFHFWIYLTVLFIITSCVTPVNLHYETAEIMDKGGLAVTGSISQQADRSYELKDTNWSPQELSFGLRLDVGVGERSNLSFRYENTFLNFETRQNFIECQWKIALGKRYFDPDKSVKFAIGIPVQYYFYKDYEALFLNPRLFITFSNYTPNFRFTLIPKVFIIYDKLIALYFQHPLVGIGISANFSFSTNIDKWALMPEIGVVGATSLSFGCGFVRKF